MSGDFLRLEGGEVILALRVQPRASRNELAGLIGQELKLRVAAPPVDDAANEEVLRFLARTLGCPRNQLRLAQGRASRHKRVGIRGLSLDQVRHKLGAGS